MNTKLKIADVVLAFVAATTVVAVIASDFVVASMIIMMVLVLVMVMIMMMMMMMIMIMM